MDTEHKPQLSVVRRNDGEYDIRDGDQLIASLYPGTALLPTGESTALRPVCLHNLRLTPAGPRMIAEGEVCGPLCLSWRKHLIYNMEIVDLDIDDSDPERLTLRVHTHDTAFRKDQPYSEDYEPDNVVEDTELIVTYDAELASYVYDVSMQLDIRPGREAFVLRYDKGGLEFGDILPDGANDYFPPRGTKRYSHIVYRAEDGTLYNRPQNKHFGPDKIGMRYAPDGFAAYVTESDDNTDNNAVDNPVIEFLDGTGARSHSQICWAMYDLHLKLRPEAVRKRLERGLPLEVRYRLYSISSAEAGKLLADSEPDPALDHPMVRCPVFTEGETNEFAPSREYRSPSDKWFWMSTDTRCMWDWGTGYRGAGSLKIDRRAERYEPEFEEAPWTGTHDFVSDGTTSSQWVFNRLPGDAGYRVTAMVRTEDVAGSAYVAVQYGGAKTGAAGLTVSEKRLSGSADWTELNVETDGPSGSNPGFAAVFLVLGGTGRCWFDHVRVSRKDER